jgi:hypothetical protein
MIERITLHLTSITRLAEQDGPYVYHLRSDTVVLMNLDCDDILDGL